MNLDQIATKCFILALFIRDDGQRLLLGDGFYDFKSNLQHFQANTIANDVVELQGDNGQLLAGQVMRSGAQKFEGYIGDATTNRQTIEQKRSDFMAFFRIKHFYQVIYIFPDGTAIQRQRGYLTDAPTVPEIFQKFPEYSIALNFEDVNYYEYAEDEHGDEIYAHIIELALSGNATGGLVWDAIGAVSNGISWSGIQAAQGEYIQVTNALDISAKLASVEMLGNAEQTTYSGKNLISTRPSSGSANGITWTLNSDGSVTVSGTATATQTISFGSVAMTQGVTYTLSGCPSGGGSGKYMLYTNVVSPQFQDYGSGATQTVTADATAQIYFIVYAGRTVSGTIYPMLEIGSSASPYEPYVGGTSAPNPEFPMPVNVVTGEQTVKIEGKNLFDGNYVAYAIGGSNGNQWFVANSTRSAIIPCAPSTTYTIKKDGGNCFSIAESPTIPENNSVVNVVFNNSAVLEHTLTTGATTRYLLVYVSNANEEPQMQAELGSTATAYEPYQGQEFEVNLGSIELAKIGDYQDRIYKDGGKWYIEKQVGKYSVSLTGLDTLTGGLKGAICSPANKATSGGDALCDRATKTIGNNIWAGSFYENPANFMFVGTSTDDAASLKDKYDGATLYYALATPTTTEITNEALIAQLDALGASSLYVGVNNIGTETQNAVPTLKIEYYTEVDLDGAGYEWEPGGNTAKTIVTVAGVDSAWPIWTVQGGAQNPTLTNITTGQTISWQGFVPEGQTLTINMAEMTADLAGANVFEYITGEWIRLAPGNNTLVYTAGSADKPSTLSWNGVLA